MRPALHPIGGDFAFAGHGRYSMPAEAQAAVSVHHRTTRPCRSSPAWSGAVLAAWVVTSRSGYRWAGSRLRPPSNAGLSAADDDELTVYADTQFAALLTHDVEFSRTHKDVWERLTADGLTLLLAWK